MATITEAELLDALAASIGGIGPTDALTVSEMEQDTGLSVKMIRRALQQANREGRLVPHRVMRRAMDGRASIVPGYTITPKQKRG